MPNLKEIGPTVWPVPLSPESNTQRRMVQSDPALKKGNKKLHQELLDTSKLILENKKTSKPKSKTSNSKILKKTKHQSFQSKLNISGFRIRSLYYNVFRINILTSNPNKFNGIITTKPIPTKRLRTNIKSRKKSEQTIELTRNQYPKIQAISDLKKLLYKKHSLNKSVVSTTVPKIKIQKKEKKIYKKECASDSSETTKIPSRIFVSRIPVHRKTTKKVIKQAKSSKRKLKPPKATKKSRIKYPSKALVTKKYIKCKEKMGLSADEFIFKPDIPITETNYPLENVNKSDLYGQDSQLDKVVSLGFTDPAIKNYIKFPSVSKIIEETISDKTKQILGNWRQKMIDELGEDGFYNHSEGLKVRGQEFHLAVRNAVLGKPADPNCSEATQNSLKSLSWVLDHIHSPMAVESTIAHPKLGYRGVADCIAMFKNIPVIIDWKLSDKPKRDLKDTYDAPVQITAYIGALNHDPNYQWGVNHGLVAVAYANGDPCDVFLLAPKHCQIYWRHWLMRFDKFKARSHLHLEHNIDEKALECI